MGDGGGRGHADDRDFPARPVDPDGGMNVIVPVQNELYAMSLQEREQVS